MQTKMYNIDIYFFTSLCLYRILSARVEVDIFRKIFFLDTSKTHTQKFWKPEGCATFCHKIAPNMVFCL